MDILKVRTPSGLKDSGRAFWKRGARVRIEDKGDGIPGGENNRGWDGESTFIRKKVDSNGEECCVQWDISLSW